MLAGGAARWATTRVVHSLAFSHAEANVGPVQRAGWRRREGRHGGRLVTVRRSVEEAGLRGRVGRKKWEVDDYEVSLAMLISPSRNSE